MDNQLKFALINEMNIIKALLRESEKDGEINPKMRKDIMNDVGRIKNRIYNDDVTFKGLYQKAKFSL